MTASLNTCGRKDINPGDIFTARGVTWVIKTVDFVNRVDANGYPSDADITAIAAPTPEKS